MITTQLLASGPPTSTWVPPAEVTGQLYTWLNLALWVVLLLSIVAVIGFGVLLVADRERGEPVSAVAPHMRAFQIALGLMILSSASALASWLVV